LLLQKFLLGRKGVGRKFSREGGQRKKDENLAKNTEK